MSVNLKALFNILNNETDIDKNLASSNAIVMNKIKEVLNNTENVIKNMTVEQAIKTILWHGVLNDHGIFSPKRDQPKKFYKFDYKAKVKVERIFYHQSFGRGNLISIDFGTSNIGKEFSLTHTAIVITDYPGFLTVIPLTSQTDKQLENLPVPIKRVIIPVFKKDYPVLESDSFILTHQIKSVSKNRITKTIGSLSKTKIMDNIEEMLYAIQSPYVKKLNNDEIASLKNEIKNLKKLIEINGISIDNTTEI